MTEEFVNEIIEKVLNCVEGSAILNALMAGKSWPKALGGDTGGTWARETNGTWQHGMWQATSTGIRITDRSNDLLKQVRPTEIIKLAKALYTKTNSTKV